MVLRALEREPERRYQHASEVKTDVQSVGGPAPTVRVVKRDAAGEDLKWDLAVHQLSGPANLLMVAAVIGFLICTVAVSVFLIVFEGTLREMAENGLPKLVVALLVSLVGGGLVIVGAWQMKKLRAYEFAVISSVLALLPITTFGWPIGLVAGVWALLVLRKPEVRAAFADELRRSLRARD